MKTLVIALIPIVMAVSVVLAKPPGTNPDEAVDHEHEPPHEHGDEHDHEDDYGYEYLGHDSEHEHGQHEQEDHGRPTMTHMSRQKRYYGSHLYGGEDNGVRPPPPGYLSPSFQYGHMAGGMGCLRNVHMGRDGMDVSSGAGAFGSATCLSGRGFCPYRDGTA